MRPVIRKQPLLAALAAIGLAASAFAAAPGSKAPAFTVTDLSGKPVSLDALNGKWVALEWTNPECPFVQKHYGAGNMQASQKYAADNQIVWVQINSTHPQHKDYHNPQKMREWNTAMKAVAAHATLDESGATGKAYGAKTTPHLYLIDPTGKLVYNGAIDDRRSSDPADIPGARNHIRMAMSEVLAGKPVSVAVTTPYGCSIKY